MDLEELRVTNSDLGVIKNNAFRHVRGLKALDLSENVISQLENEAFTDVSLSCEVHGDDDSLNGPVFALPWVRTLWKLVHERSSMSIKIPTGNGRMTNCATDVRPDPTFTA